MTEIDLDALLEKWQRLLLVFAGAAVTLLVITLVDLPSNAANWLRLQMFVVDGWFGVWFILEIACLAGALNLLVSPALRTLPFTRRRGATLGFFACAWAGLLALDLRLAGLAGPAFHAVTFFSGLALLVITLWLRRARPGEELFP